MIQQHFSRRLGGLAAVLTTLLSGCGPTAPPITETPPPPVTVSKPVVRQVIDFDNYEGHIKAAKTVNVRARVRGHLIKVHFQAGAIVKEGELLYEIDPRPAKAELDAAKAQEKRRRCQPTVCQGGIQSNANAPFQRGIHPRGTGDMDRQTGHRQGRRPQGEGRCGTGRTRPELHTNHRRDEGEVEPDPGGRGQSGERGRRRDALDDARLHRSDLRLLRRR